MMMTSSLISHSVRQRHGHHSTPLQAILSILVLLAAFSGVTAQPYGNVMEVINSHANLTIVRDLVDKFQLTATLSSSNLSATVFLPTDEAFRKFAMSLNATTDQLLRIEPPEYMTKLLQYHIARVSTNLSVLSSWAQIDLIKGVLELSTFLSPSPKEKRQYTSLRLALSNISAATRVRGTGSDAGMVEVDIPAGEAFVYVIDNVLTYWYNTIADAIAAHNDTTQLTSSLKAAGLWQALNDTSAEYTFFGPDDNAFTAATNDYSIDFSVNGTNSYDILTYHVAYGTQELDFSNMNISTQFVTLSQNKTLAMRSTDGAAIVAGVGSFASIVPWMIPVGGPVTRSHVQVINTVLMPVFTNIWQCIEATNAYASLTSFIKTEPGYIYPLTNPKLTITLLAPNNQAIADFVSKAGATSLGSYYVFPNDKRLLLTNHLLNGPRTRPDFVNGATFTTVAGFPIRVGVASSGVVFASDKTVAGVVTPMDVPILYGRSYVQTVNYVLVPAGLRSPGDGSAGTAVPSMLLLAFTLLVGRVAIMGKLM